MKKTSKIISAILIMMLLITMVAPIAMAADKAGAGAGDGTGPITPGSVDGSSSTVDVQGVTDLGNDVVRVITTIGIVVSVIILVVLGIKYMMGSAEEKAEYKKTLMPYIIGAGLVFAASSIATIVYNVATNINVQ